MRSFIRAALIVGSIAAPLAVYAGADKPVPAGTAPKATGSGSGAGSAKAPTMAPKGTGSGAGSGSAAPKAPKGK